MCALSMSYPASDLSFGYMYEIIKLDKLSLIKL